MHNGTNAEVVTWILQHFSSRSFLLMKWGTLSLTRVVGRRQLLRCSTNLRCSQVLNNFLGAQEDSCKVNVGRCHSSGSLSCQESEMMKGTIQTDIFVCPIMPRTGSFYTLEICPTTITGTKYEN